MKKLVVYWSRRDFRVHDNPALSASISAVKNAGGEFLPLFIAEPYMKKGIAYAQRLFLAKAIPEFFAHFSVSAVCKGTVTHIFRSLAKEHDIEIFVNEDIHPDFYSQIEKLKKLGAKASKSIPKQHLVEAVEE